MPEAPEGYIKVECQRSLRFIFVFFSEYFLHGETVSTR